MSEDSKSEGSQVFVQKEYDESVSTQNQLLGKFCFDDKINEEMSTFLFIRKFWFRMKLYSLFETLREKNVEEEKVNVLIIGGGKDTICRNFKNWNLIRVDKEKYENSMQMNVDDEIGDIEKIISSENVKVLIIEGLMYHLEQKTVEKIMEFLAKYDLYYILDGIDSNAVEFQKGRSDADGMQFKSFIPLEKIPHGGKVLDSNDFINIFGDFHFNKPALENGAKFYYISNF